MVLLNQVRVFKYALRYSKKSPALMGPEGSLLCSQKRHTSLSPQPDKFRLKPYILLLSISF